MTASTAAAAAAAYVIIAGNANEAMTAPSCELIERYIPVSKTASDLSSIVLYSCKRVFTIAKL